MSDVCLLPGSGEASGIRHHHPVGQHFQTLRDAGAEGGGMDAVLCPLGVLSVCPAVQ